MSSFTPGPWRVKPDTLFSHAFNVVSDNGVHVAWCAGWQAPNKENAHLIAAAPEMLAALERWEAIYRKGTARITDMEWDQAVTLTDEALAAARGQKE